MELIVKSLCIGNIKGTIHYLKQHMACHNLQAVTGLAAFFAKVGEECSMASLGMVKERRQHRSLRYFGLG